MSQPDRQRHSKSIRHEPPSSIASGLPMRQQFAGWTVVSVVKFSFCERPGGQAGDSGQGEDLHD